MNIAYAPIFQHQGGWVALTHQQEIQQETTDPAVSIGKGVNRFKAVIGDGSTGDGVVLLSLLPVDPLLPLAHPSGNIAGWRRRHVASSYIYRDRPPCPRLRFVE